MALPALLLKVGAAVSTGASIASTAGSVASVAKTGLSALTKTGTRAAKTAGRAMGRRRERRRDRIQEQLFGQPGDRGGALVHSPGGAIVPFSNNTTSQRVIPDPSPGSGILGILNSIRSSLEQILEVEKQQRDSIQESILNFAKTDEQAKRTAEQQKQEAKKPTRKRDRAGGAIKNLAAGPLEILQEFIKFGILNWIGDPRNKQAVQNIVKFFRGMIDVLKWTWKWIGAPLAKTIGIIGGPVLKTFGSFFTLLGNLFTGKIFTDPKEFFRSLLDFPVQLINMIPDIIGGFIRWIGGALWGATTGIIGGIIDAIRNLFGGIFGGGKKSSGMSTNFAGGPMPGAGADGQPGKDGADGKDGSKGDSGTDGVDSPIPMGKGATELPELGGSTYNQDKKVEQQVVNPSPVKKDKTDTGMSTNFLGGGVPVVQPVNKFVGDDKAPTTDKEDDKKPQGFMRGLAGVGDYMTGGLFDFDKRGDSGLQRAQKGMMDFATGGLLDLDGKGGKTWGTSRVLAGVADKLTGDRWDFDRHGKSGSILDEVQKESQTLDSQSTQTNQEAYGFGDASHTESSETSDSGSLGSNLPRTGCKPFTTCL